MKEKKVVILGSTGSIGTSAAMVVRDLKDKIQVLGLAAGNNVDLLAAQANEFHPACISIADPDKVPALKNRLEQTGSKYTPRVTCGEEGLLELATMDGVDIVLIAIVGTGGLAPALAAIRAGKDIAVASKEILVMAGEFIMNEAKAHGVRVLAVDSEHSAIFQCLDGKPLESIRKIILTASGGPFRKTPAEDFESITVAMALKHPSWVMGQKITIDSATLFNKGLEMIEARWLFGLPIDQVDVVVHPQSVVHSMVEFVDGSILAQMSTPDMCLPIQYALTYPDRVVSERVQTHFPSVGALEFEEPDVQRFPSLKLAREAARCGGTLPAVFNAANEIAASQFLKGALTFPGITRLVSRVMEAHDVIQYQSLDEILEADSWARSFASQIRL